MNDLQVKIGGSAEQLKAAVNQAKAEINSLDKTAKNAGGGALGGFSKDAPKILGQVKEIGSKFQGLGGIMGGLVPALGPIGVVIAGLTLVTNKLVERWQAYKTTIADTAKNLAEAARIRFSQERGIDELDPTVKAKLQLAALEKLEKKLRAEQTKDDKQTASGSITQEYEILGGNSYYERKAAREKTLSEIELKRLNLRKTISKAESEADVEASRVAAKNYEEEKKRNEEAKKRYNEASFAAASEEEQLAILRDQAAEISWMADAREGSSTAQIEAATEYLKIEKQISDILEKRADKQKTAAEKEAAKQEELKQITYERIWGEATAEQRLAQAQKEYLAAKVKAEKDANTDNLIALEKTKTKVLEQKKAVQALNAEKGKGNEEKTERPRTPDGKVIVSEEDRARSDADKARNAGFQSEIDRSRIKVNGVSLAKPRVPSVDSGKTSANEVNNGSTWQQDIKDIRGYLAPKNI